MKNKLLNGLFVTLLASTLFITTMNAETLNCGKNNTAECGNKNSGDSDSIIYSYDIGGTAPTFTGNGGTVSAKSFYSFWDKAIGVKVSLINQNKKNASAESTYYYMTFKRATYVCKDGSNMLDWSDCVNHGGTVKILNSWPYEGLASGKYNIGNSVDGTGSASFKVCGSISNGKYTTDCESVIKAGVTWGRSDLLSYYGKANGAEYISSDHLHDWVFNTNNTVEHEGFYQTLYDLEIWNIPGFTHLNHSSLKELQLGIIEMGEKGNKLLDDYILVYEPIYEYGVGYNWSGYPQKYAYFTMKGIATQLVNNNFRFMNKSNNISVAFLTNHFINNMFAVSTHGSEFITKNLDNYKLHNYTNPNANTLTIMDWKTISDAHNGWGYGIYGLSEMVKYIHTPICEIVEENGELIYYDDLGQINKERYFEKCTKKCEPKKVVNMPNTCTTATSGYAEDDKMCSILNSSVKDKYKVTQANSKLTSTFIGSDICEIYCREKYEFNFMDKSSGIAGRFFQYDVESKYANDNLLTTVALATRECTSVIDYDTWASQYTEANEKVVNAWNTYKDNNNTSNEKTLSDAINNRDSVIYKLEDCNFMQSSKDINNEMNTEATYKSSNGTLSLRNYNLLLDYEPNSKLTFTYSEKDKDSTNVYEVGNNTGSNELSYDVRSAFVNISYSKDDYKTTCSSCDSDVSTDKSSNNEEVTMLTCTYSSGSYSCSDGKINIPVNKIATITVESEVAYYQGTNFSTRLLKGDVKMTSKVSDNQNYAGGYRQIIARNIYPIGANTLTGSYGVTLNYSNLGSNSKSDLSSTSGTYTCSYQVYNLLNVYECGKIPDTDCKCDPSKEVCENPKDEPSSSLGYYFRVVDLKNMFPNERTYATNWTTEAAKQITKEIEELGDNYLTSRTPMYKVILTQANIKKIKNYNTKNNYIDTQLVCDGYRCYSLFLRNNTTGTLNTEVGANTAVYDWGTITVNTQNVSSNHYYGN